MAQQPINHGTVAGDGTGDTLFDAFQKVNANETELYAAKAEMAANASAFPVTGETTKLYIALDTGIAYRWTGSAYLGITVGVATVNGQDVLVGKGGVNYAALPIVAPDLVEANVNLRTDTRANLLALASGGGTSEIGYDPATSSLVMFTGVPGEAKISGREAIVARLIAPISSTTPNANNTTPTAVPFNLTGAFYNNDGLLDAGGDLSEILIPAGIDVTSVRIQGHLKFAAGAGISRRIRVEGWNGSSWITATMPVVEFGNPTSTTVNAGNTPQTVYCSLNIIAHFYLQAIPFTKLRLVVLADAAVALTTMSSGSPIMVELFAGIKTAI